MFSNGCDPQVGNHCLKLLETSWPSYFLAILSCWVFKTIVVAIINYVFCLFPCQGHLKIWSSGSSRLLRPIFPSMREQVKGFAWPGPCFKAWSTFSLCSDPPLCRLYTGYSSPHGVSWGIRGPEQRNRRLLQLTFKRYLPYSPYRSRWKDSAFSSLLAH